MTNSKQARSLNTPCEQHFGDLRKGAYLKRRAAYQMQAGDSCRPQAGTLTAKGKSSA